MTATPKRTSRNRNVPAFLVLAWWLICTGFFAIGWPIPYVRTNLFSVVSMMAACGVAFWIGYRIATARTYEVAPLKERYPRAIFFGAVAAVALIGPIASAYSGYSIAEVGEALGDQGAAFDQSTQRILEGTESRTGLLLVQSALAPLTLVALPLAALYWFEKRRGLPIFLVTLSVPIITSILVGRDQQLGWSVIIVASAWLVSRYRRGIGVRVRDVIVVATVGVVFAVLFALRKTSRGLTGAVCPPGSSECIGVVETRSVFEAAFQSLASYMSQGLEGLGRAFNTEWVFGGGLAHAPAINGLFARLLGYSPSPSVSTQLSSVDWSATWYWSTAITSLANDIPWLLIPLLFIALGALVGSSWVRSLRDGDFLSIGVFTLSFLGAIFTPQNLQLAVSGPTYLGYLALVFAYIVRGAIQKRRASSFVPSRALPTT